jgi:hypothetical protein
MGFDIDCSVSCNCSECGTDISEDDLVYCEVCYEDRTPKGVGISSSQSALFDCKGCQKRFTRGEVVEKIAGYYCEKCVISHEEELLRQMVVKV